MWNREEIKSRARRKLSENYGGMLAVTVLLSLVYDLSNKSSLLLRRSYFGEGATFGTFFREGFGGLSGLKYMTGLFWTSSTILMIILFQILRVLLGNLIRVGANRYFMKNRNGNPDVGTILFGFHQGRYKNMFFVTLLVDLFVCLWSLLLVVPGIIKHYEYAMVEYLLAENPEMNYQRAFELSKKMTNGQKMDMFMLDLSFIGWGILSLFTCGLVGIFYLNPYVEASWAELYAALRSRAFYNEWTDESELPGFEEGEL